MSAPNTNVETQAKRHSPALSGIATALVVAGALAVALILWLVTSDELIMPTPPSVEQTNSVATG